MRQPRSICQATRKETERTLCQMHSEYPRDFIIYHEFFTHCSWQLPTGIRSDGNPSAGSSVSGSRGRLPAPSSHTTVRTVPYTAVQADHSETTEFLDELREKVWSIPLSALQAFVSALHGPVHRLLSARRTGLDLRPITGTEGSARLPICLFGLRSRCIAALWPLLPPARPSNRPRERSSYKADVQGSWGKARDVRPIHPPHIRPTVLDDIWTSGGLAPSSSVVASYAVRVPRARALLTASSPRSLAVPRSCCSARSSRHRASRGLSPPRHVPVGFRLPVAGFKM
jgi:hypothetical protein